jgi:hypothetical protein
MSLVASASTVANAICAGMSPPVTDSAAQAKWLVVVTQIFTGIVNNAVATVPASSIVTTGGPATQTGPAAPVPLAIS